jgi:hypothetical protein
MLARRVRLDAGALRELSVGDRDFLVLKLGQASFGGRVTLTLACPLDACGARMDVDFEIDDLPVNRLPRQAGYPVSVPGGDTPPVRFRLPGGGDLEACAVRGAGDPEAALLARCLVGPDGAAATDPVLRSAVDAELDRVMPGVPREVSAVCPECGHEFDTAFDPVVWLLRRVWRGRDLLDRDIHLLSFHYHWPLEAILEMAGPVRREYVSLLEHELGLAMS